jgi:lipopolysaccharide transport system ATP-binding protein
MSKIVIKAENISKAYELGEFSTGTISRDLERWWAMMRGKEDPFLKIGEVNDRNKKTDSKLVWSLKDINFEVEEGSAVGIIGRNGAGKSTLLKLLSRITSPTTGTIKGRGRIASLLEVGTGFHPELTGRENIFINGAILGMRKAEIKKRFDEIVDFAGVERYIDTPVKRYSSGMYVRLAFAVAAHLEAEILIVDEVLAVGDAEFQRKCMGKMGQVTRENGRTVLFVSHNVESVKALCNTAILLNNGRMHENTNLADAIKIYLQQNPENDRGHFVNQNPPGSLEVYFKQAYIKQKGLVTNALFNDAPIDVHCQLQCNFPIKVSLEAIVRNHNGFPLLFGPVGLTQQREHELEAGIHNMVIRLNPPYLAKGGYFLDLIVAETGKRIIDIHESCLAFEIESSFIAASGWSFDHHRGAGSILLNAYSYFEDELPLAH